MVEEGKTTITSERLWFWFVCAFFSRIVLFLIDNTPRFFFGDSLSYIATDMSGHLPEGRSWTYGLIIDVVFSWTGSITSLAMLQMILVSLTMTQIMAIVERESGRNMLLLAFIFFLLAVNPITLYYERAILTEAVSAFVFVTLLGVTIHLQIVRITVVGIVLLAFLTILLISLRTAYLPTLLFFFWIYTGIALLLNQPIDKSKLFKSLILPAVISFTTLSAVYFYSQLNGYIFNRPPSINYQSNQFLMGVLAPAIPHECLLKSGLSISATEFEDLDLTNRELRNHQIFSSSKLVKKYFFNQVSGKDSREQAMNSVARCTVLNNPFAVLNLAIAQQLDYLNYSKSKRNIESAYILSIHKNFDTHFLDSHLYPFIWQRLPDDIQQRETKSMIWLQSVGAEFVWVMVASSLVAPIYLVLLRRRRKFSAEAVIVVSAGFVYVLSLSVFSVAIIHRYTIPLAFTAPVIWAIWLSELTGLFSSDNNLPRIE